MSKAFIRYAVNLNGRDFKKGDEMEIIKEIERPGLNSIFRASSPLYPGDVFNLLSTDFELEPLALQPPALKEGA